MRLLLIAGVSLLALSSAPLLAQTGNPAPGDSGASAPADQPGDVLIAQLREAVDGPERGIDGP